MAVHACLWPKLAQTQQKNNVVLAEFKEANTVFRLLFSIVLCWSFQLGAVSWQRLTLDDALPNVGVYSLVQDPSGFIWFGSTNVGIVRYDGVEFRSYPLNNINRIGEVPDINKLMFDQDGFLWAGSWGYGLLRIDVRTGHVESFSAGDSAHQLHSPFVQSLLQDHLGRIWIGTNQGLNRYDTHHGLIKITGDASPHQQRLIHPRIWSIAETDNGRIWLATSRGLHFYTDQSGLSAAIEPHGPAHADNEIRALLSDGRWLWVATRAGLFRLDSETLALEQIPYYRGTQFPIINTLVKDQHGHILVGSFDGISQLHPETLRLQPLEAGGNTLSGVNVRTLFVDKTGLVWAGTRERGIFKARLFDGEFNLWPADASYTELRQAAQPVLSFFHDEQGLWLGRANGIDWQLSQQSQVEHFISNARINAFAKDNLNQLWVGTDTGLLRFAQGTFVRDNQPLEGLTLAARNVRDIQFSPDGRMVLGLWGDGVVIQSPTARQHLLATISQTTTGDAVQDIEIIGDYLFIATRLTGLYRYSFANSELQSMNQRLPSLGRAINCLARGPADTLLMCTEQGLQQLHLLTQQISSYGMAHNLVSEHLLGAYTDEFDRIWVLSSQGLSVLPKAEQRFINYGEAEGLSSREMMFKAVEGQKGAVFVGTAAGIDRVGTARIWQNRAVPTPILSTVIIDHQSLPSRWYGQCCAQIQLMPGQNSMRLRFASLDFNDVQLNQLDVQLEGYDKEWQQLRGDMSKSYDNLPPGQYQLAFRGSNNHGVMSPVTRVLVVVEPQWFQRTWVQLLMLLLVLGSIAAFYLYRLKQLHKINQLLHDSVQAKAVNEQQLELKVAERTTQLRAVLSDLAESNVHLKHLDSLKDDFISTVSHELRTPLTSIHGAIRLLNSGQMQQRPEVAQQLLQTAEENSNRLIVLINDLLDLQKFESGAMQLNTQQVDLPLLVQQAVQGLHTYASRYQVRLAILSPLASLAIDIDSLRIRQVLDNLLSNAIKFSRADAVVEVSLHVLGDRVRVEVKDYGEGIPLDVQRRLFGKFVQADGSSNKMRYGSGLGLVISKRIIELHGGEIGFESSIGVGSTFWFSLPLHQAELQAATSTEPSIRAWPTTSVNPR